MSEIALSPFLVPLMARFEERGNIVLGVVVGLGVLLGVLALIIIAGRMIHTNFTGDPWIAARGMAELPWVLLGICLLIAGGGLVTTFFQDSIHQTEGLDDLMSGIVTDVTDAEDEHNDGCLQYPDTRDWVCPDDEEEWDEAINVIPVSGPRDLRCTISGDYANCYEYCELARAGRRGTTSNCRSSDGEVYAIWLDYYCPNGNSTGSSLTGEMRCKGRDDLDSSDYSDEIRENIDEILGDMPTYRCTFYPEYVEVVNPTRAGQGDEEYCEGRTYR